jgi:DNA-binding IclR family transcriptional regulator
MWMITDVWRGTARHRQTGSAARQRVSSLVRTRLAMGSERLTMSVDTTAPAQSTRASTVSGVRHAGEILGLFTRDAPEWGAAAAARELGISRSHAHRLLRSLTLLGLLERQTSTKRYRLGMRSLALASVLVETSPLFANALPIMRSLNDQLDLQSALAVWDRGGVLWLQPGGDRLLAHHELEDRVAAGTVLLAGRPDTEAETASHIAQAPVIAPGATCADDLRGRVEHVRAGGLIGDFRAGNGGTCHLAAPIMDARGSVVAALSVQAPRSRWQIRKHEFTCALHRAALLLTSRVVRD